MTTLTRRALAAATLPFLLFLSAHAAAQPAPEPPPADPAAEWTERERALSESMSLAGGVGLLHTQHAQGGIPGQLRVSFIGEYFSAGFLCSSSFPCPNPKGGAALTSDSLTHIGGTLALSVPLTTWLEGYLSTVAYANSDDANVPALLTVIGDTDVGLKAFAPLTKVLRVGGGADLLLVNGADAVGVAGSSTGAKFRALGTADLRQTDARTPLRFSLNLAYWLDNTGTTVTDIETGRGNSITRIERFGLGINRVDHFVIDVGAEAFLSDDHVRPFVELHAEAPISRQDYVCKVGNPAHDLCLAHDKVVPSKLTFGSRFLPWKKGFSFLAALDLGVTGVHDFIEEVTPTPPWMLYLGLGWALDTREPPPVVKTREIVRTIEAKPPVLGHFTGFAHARDKTDGVADAIVVFADHPEQTSLATGKDGHFTSPDLPDGTYKLTVHAEGYKDGACEAAIPPPAGKDAQVDCPLEKALVQVTAREITISQQVQFAFDSAEILLASSGLMAEIADTLNKNPRIKRVEVQGHTDAQGTNEHNMKLSEARANSVRDWLIAHGVAADRLIARGYGEERPLFPNDSDERMAANRRVQFIILEQTPEEPPAKP